MDNDPGLDAVDEQSLAARSGQDRRATTDRRRGMNRLLELRARRDGLDDRRQRKRRSKSHGFWLSFLRLLKAD